MPPDPCAAAAIAGRLPPTAGCGVARRYRERAVVFRDGSTPIGIITVGIDSEGTVGMPLDHVIQILQPILDPAVLDSLQARAMRFSRDRVTVSDLRAVNLDAAIDPASQDISVALAPSQRAHIGERQFAPHMPSSIEPPLRPAISAVTFARAFPANPCAASAGAAGGFSPMVGCGVARPYREITVPFRYGRAYAGDVTIGVDSDGTVHMPLVRVVQLLRPVAYGAAVDALRARAERFARTHVTLNDFKAAGLDAAANPSSLEITVRPAQKDNPEHDTPAHVLAAQLVAPGRGTVVPIPPSAPRVDTAPPIVQTSPVVPQHSNKKMELIVPFKERSYYLGDVTIGIAPDGSVDMPLDRVLEILKTIASPSLLDAIRKQAGNRTRISFDDLNALKLNAAYDPSTLEVSIVLPLEDRQRRELELYSPDSIAVGQFMQPASTSAWLTWRTSFDYVNKGAASNRAFVRPVIDLTGAANVFGAVLSAGGRYNTDSSAGNIFERDYTRLTYDQPQYARRFELGDLDPAVVGFQTSPDMAGISVLQSYTQLQPGRNIRPRGLTSFSLRDASTVDVLINGQFVRQLNLDVGTYDLRDFPFTAGQNNVQLVVQDSTGQRELYSYQQFYDLNLLQPGLTEYQLAAGIAAPFTNGSPHYEVNRPTATGFIRRGVSEDLTLGANSQADNHGVQLGLESVWASPIGILGAQIAASMIGDKRGWAALLNFQHQDNPAPGEHRWSLGINLEATSPWFSAIGVTPTANDTALNAAAYYSRDLTPETSLNLNVGYLWKRGTAENAGQARLAVYQRIGDSTSVGGEVRWDQSLGGHHDLGFYVTISTRFGSDQYASASYDEAADRARLSWQKTPTEAYDDWSFSADAERVAGSVAFNGTAYRQWNRLETSLTHTATYDESGKAITDERTSLRAAGSIAYADGTVAVGRPIQDSFAIVDKHPSLEDATVRVDPRGDSESARTDALGPALVPDLSAYSRRTLVLGVDGLPTGYNLDSGTFDLLPPYRSGYKLTVGSDYSISVIGLLNDRDGNPVTLIAGKAYPADDPKGHTIELFTDRKGRFAATGLKPGKWRIELGEYRYDLDVPEGKTLQRLTTPLKPIGDQP